LVFVLGLNVGRQIGARQAEAARAGSLEALDRAPSGPGVPEASLTFHDRLTKAKPEAAPPPGASAAPAPSAPPSAPAEKAASEKPPAAIAEGPKPAPTAPAAAPPRPATPAAVPAAAPAPGAFTIQLGASPDRAEADRIAARFEAFQPRVEAADVSGKRVYRVRVGSFETKDAAARYLADVTRETGAKGWVTASR
jgi:cell division septation protein DedD